MPLIACPVCNRITYAYPIYGEDGSITAYRCSQCYNTFNADQVNTVPFPNEEIVLNTTFKDFIAYVDKVEPDEVKEEGRALAERFLMALLFLARPEEPRLYRDRRCRVVFFYAPWDYRGTREAEERNDELLEEAQRIFAEAVDRNYVVVEFREMDEGDSIFIAVHPDDVNVIMDVLRRHGFLLVKNIYSSRT